MFQPKGVWDSQKILAQDLEKVPSHRRWAAVPVPRPGLPGGCVQSMLANQARAWLCFTASRGKGKPSTTGFGSGCQFYNFKQKICGVVSI